MVKYPANKVNPYLDKVISAQRANVKWLCEEQFKCATLILTRSFSSSCSDDFRRKVFGKFVGRFVIFTQRLLYAFEMKALIVLAQSFLALAQESYEIASGLHAHKVTSGSNLIGPLHCASAITIAMIIASFSEQQLQLLYSLA